MAQRTASRASHVHSSCGGPVVTVAVAVENIGRRTVNLQRHLIANLGAAVTLVLCSDSLTVGHSRVNQGPLAETLKQLDFSFRHALPAPADPHRFRAKTEPQVRPRRQ